MIPFSYLYNRQSSNHKFNLSTEDLYAESFATNTLTGLTPALCKATKMGACILACVVSLTACQTPQQVTQPDSTTTVVGDGQQAFPELLQAFNIGGKIGITIPQTETQSAQSGSAFYVWAQEDNRFAIDIKGALGIGHTVIEYNGTTATLVSQKTGEITASSPEELLYQATGWQAPISQLRYWISGRPAPSDEDYQIDEYGRLSTSQNENWTADFYYKSNATNDSIPWKIKVVRTDGYKVIMTINHSQS